MKLSEFLKKWNLDSLRINAQFLQAEITFNDADRRAAWNLYIELLTRISTQQLPDDVGDEKTALDSIYSLFPTTRQILKEAGPGAQEFTKIAIVVLNQVIRPFLAEWHGKSLGGKFEDATQRAEFREDLRALQVKIRNYTKLLSEIADVEDLTMLEVEH